MPAALGAWCVERAREQGLVGPFDVVDSLVALEASVAHGARMLVSFGTGITVPARILDLPGMQAVNIHAASPAFPGRDPHHFAAYADAKVYGATLHRMIRRVDAGPILCVELRPVAGNAGPEALLAMANDCGKVLFERLLRRLVSGDGLPEADPNLRWSGSVGTRRAFLELCRVHPAMDRVELDRRIRACSMPGYANLYLDLHGHRFWHRPEGPR